MRKKPSVTHGTTFHVYYTFGSVYSGALCANTRKELLAKMKSFCEEHKEKAEVITFDGIRKTVETKEVKGKMIRFVPKFTNDYLRGSRLNKWYKELA